MVVIQVCEIRRGKGRSSPGRVEWQREARIAHTTFRPHTQRSTPHTGRHRACRPGVRGPARAGLHRPRAAALAQVGTRREGTAAHARRMPSKLTRCSCRAWRAGHEHSRRRTPGLGFCPCWDGITAFKSASAADARTTTDPFHCSVLTAGSWFQGPAPARAMRTRLAWSPTASWWRWAATTASRRWATRGRSTRRKSRTPGGRSRMPARCRPRGGGGRRTAACMRGGGHASRMGGENAAQVPQMYV